MTIIFLWNKIHLSTTKATHRWFEYGPVSEEQANIWTVSGRDSQHIVGFPLQQGSAGKLLCGQPGHPIGFRG